MTTKTDPGFGMLRMNPISRLIFLLMILIAMANESIAEEDYKARRDAAEYFLTTSPNTSGVWEANEYGTLVHMPSGFRCNPGHAREILKLAQLITVGSPIGDEVSCIWDIERNDGALSITVRRSSEITLKRELTRNIAELRAQHAAQDDGIPMSMGGQPPFELESARLQFLDVQNRQMHASIWVYFANGWVISTRAFYPVEDEQGFNRMEFMAATQAFGGVADILSIDGPIRLAPDDG